MLSTVFSYTPQMLALFGLGTLVYLLVTKVLAPGVTTLKGFATVAKTDVAAIEARVTALEVAAGFKPAPVAVATGPTGVTGTVKPA